MILFTILLLIGASVGLYYFIIIPEAVKLEHEYRNPPKVSHYYKDLANLEACIKRAETKTQIKMCCDAVYSFKYRNRALLRGGIRVDLDTDSLIELIDKQLKQINLKMKPNRLFNLFY